MDFWKGERCEYCDGDIVEKKVDLSRKAKGSYVLIYLFTHCNVALGF